MALTPRRTRFHPVAPTPAQTTFLLIPHLEALYGGAAGGGKSIALLYAALQYVDVPGYDAILFRRTYQDLALPEALMDVAQGWLGGTDAKWSSIDHRWTFPSGATLSFGYLATSADRYRYQSAAFQFIGFDELTQFPETDYRYLFSRLRRREDTKVPLRMRAATNPGGLGHEWVKRRFIDGKEPDRVFIPARLDDNPHLDRVSYEASLQHLDPISRAHLLAGNWDAQHAGSIFRAHWFGVVDQAPRDTEWVRYWDLAATAREVASDDPDYTAGVLLGWSDEAKMAYVGNVRRVRLTPKGVERTLRQVADTDHPDTVVWIEREPGASGKAYIDHIRQDVLPDKAVFEDRVSGDKVTRAMPAASNAEAGNVKVLRGEWTTAFLDELEAFPLGRYDDQVDAFSGAWRRLAMVRVTESTSPFGTSQPAGRWG